MSELEKNEELNGLEFLKRIKTKYEANDRKGIKTDLSGVEIKFIRNLAPARYPEEPYDLYKFRQKLKKRVDKYVRMVPNSKDRNGKALPRKKEV